MNSPEEIFNLFQVNYIAMSANIKDIDNQTSLIKPQPAGNHINWVLGHILVSRGMILEMLDEKPVLSDIQAAPYKRGSVSNPMDFLLPFEALVDRLNQSQIALKGAFGKITQDQLALIDEESDLEWKRQPLGDRLLFLHFHEAYHIGQLGLLRRLAGMEGVIQ